MSLGVCREGERELACTSNGGGVIMVIGRERPTVRSMNLRTKDRERRGEGEEEPSGLGKEGSAESEGTERKRGVSLALGEGYFLSFREKTRLF